MNPPCPSVTYAQFLNVAVCNDSNCQHAVKLENIARHLRQVHSIPNQTAAEIQSEILSKQIALPDPIPADRQCYFDTTTSVPTDSRPLSHPLPLPALNFLPVVECLQCSNCGTIKPKKDAMKRHIRGCLVLPKQAPIKDPIPVLAQSIYGGKNTAWFPVITEQCEAVLQLLQKDQGSAPGTASEIPVPHLDSFLSEMRFDVQLEETYKISMEDAYNATQWSSLPPFPHARRVLAAYLHHAFTLAAQNAYIKSHTILNSPLRLSLSTETLRIYIVRLSRLLTFLLTVSDWPQPKRILFMTNAQVFEIKQFQQLCSIADPNLSTAISKLHVIVRSIMFDPVDSRQSVMPLFIACTAVRRKPGNIGDFRFAAASETSPILASLKYLIKCAVVTHIYSFSRTAPDREEAWKQLKSATSEDADSGATVVASVLRCCLRLAATESHHINMVLCTRHSMCAIVDGQEVSVPGLALAVHSLQQKAWTILQDKLLMGLTLNCKFWTMLGELQDALGEKSAGYWYLMHPNNYESLNAWRRAYVNAVHPHLFNSDVTVKTNPAKEFITHVETLQDIIYTLMQICSGGPARATEAAVLRIRNTPTATRGIFVSQGQLLTILTYNKTRCMQNGTGRAIVRFPDSVTAGFMHIFMIIIHPLYILIRAQVEDQTPGGDDDDDDDDVDLSIVASKIGPSHKTSRLDKLPPPSDAGNPLDFMFDASSADRLRTAFASCLASANIPLSTTQYRHFHSAVLKHYLPTAASLWHTTPHTDEDQSNSATMHLQAGHTEHTATTTYGVTRSQLTSITATELQQFRNASQTWHRVLRLPTGHPIPFTEKRHPNSFSSGARLSHHVTNHSDNPGTKSISSPTCQSANGATSPNVLVTSAQIFARLDCIENNLNILVSNLSRSSAPDQGDHGGGGGADNNCSNGAADQARTNTASSSQLVPNTTSTAAAASLSLQKFLQSPEAQFKSSEQKSAVLHALQQQPRKDLLVVMPTGSGKSLLFMLPAFMNPDKVSVVVVPLVSLQHDIIHRCARKGITAARFSDAVNTPDVRIVLVSAEQLVLPAYASFLRTAAATERLHGIFIDEAHLVLLWKRFRTTLQDVREFIRPNDVSVSIVAMTATCPPPLEKDISHACGMRDWDVLRSATTRSNIRYSVTQVSAANMLLSAAQLIARVAAEDSTGQNGDTKTRMILYIQNKARCNAVEHVFSLICPQVQCLVYHADLTDEQRSEALQKWQAIRSVKPRLMVATSAFGCGIDVPSVRCVLHLGLPATVIDFLQESGRAGRDGMPAQSVIIHQPRPSNRCIAPQDDQDMKRFGMPTKLCTTPKTDCRRWFLDSFADGIVDNRSCHVRQIEPCDHCAALSQGESRENELQVSADETLQTTVGNNGLQGQQLQAQNNDANAAAAVLPGTDFVTANHALQLSAAGQPQHGHPTPGQLCDLAEHLNGTCPPCSVASGRLVRHTTQSTTCFNNLCLRCCASGHKAAMCTNLTVAPGEVGCYTCTLNKINGLVVHNPGTYGKRTCQLKTVFCFCISMWENNRLQSFIRQRVQETATLLSTAQFVHWLRNGSPTGSNNMLGILQMVPLLVSKYSAA